MIRLSKSFLFYSLNMSLFLTILYSLFITQCVVGFTQDDPPVNICSKTTSFAPNSTYQKNLNSLLNSLSANAARSNGFFHTAIGSGSDTVYGLLLCQGDQTDSDCNYDVLHAVNYLSQNCAQIKAAILWYNKCMVRYSNKSFVGTMDESPGMYAWNGVYNLDHYTTDTTAFWQLMLDLVGDIVKKAAEDKSGMKYATKQANFGANLTQYQTLYALAQCTPDLTVGDCNTCLQGAIKNMSISCYMMVGCWMMFPSCNIRYDVLPIYKNVEVNASSPAPLSEPISPAPSAVTAKPFRGGGTSRKTKRRKRPVIVGAGTTAAVLAVVLFGFLFAVCKKTCKKSRPQTSLTLSDSMNFREPLAESMKFDIKAIKYATNNFSEDTKLGEGGFGEVFKGKLESGQEVAVKRLSSNSKQGISEFKTEVLLVAKLQHRNLVKLLGFCITETEKLLVYEFLPNSSLDRFLFDPIKSASLDWETRYKIIYGIARGLLYLHEDSRLKIIHRDLKSSNVLLDKDMNPKISDFGMARLFGADETQRNTKKIAGTFGYMAPEYAITGHFSVKSDVYSFGIIVLEIVSGQRNNFLRRHQDEESLLHRAWRLWMEGLYMELVDSKIGNNFKGEEVSKCIHMGLLCVQEDAGKRPRMASVVAALNGNNVTLPSPTPPRFFTGASDEIQECATIFTGSNSISDLDPR